MSDLSEFLHALDWGFIPTSSCIHEMYLWTDSQEMGHGKHAAMRLWRLEGMHYILSMYHNMYTSSWLTREHGAFRQ